MSPSAPAATGTEHDVSEDDDGTLGQNVTQGLNPRR